MPEEFTLYAIVGGARIECEVCGWAFTLIFDVESEVETEDADARFAEAKRDHVHGEL